MTANYTYFCAREKGQNNILFCTKVWERLSHSESSVSTLVNPENYHEKKKVSNKTEKKGRVNTLYWLTHTS